ncbi:MAG: extracellular matrix regulator RemB [Oscillospiraceae bacterium]
MYLHLGQNVVVPTSRIVGIFDIDNTTQSHITRAFLNQAEKSGQIINICDDIPKSFIVCEEDGKRTVYLSQLMSATLFKRSETVAFD